MKRLLWLDDMRDPFADHRWIANYASQFVEEGTVYWAKSYKEFTDWISTNGLPDMICFDHDLGDLTDHVEKTGHDCAKWLVDYCLDRDLDLPSWNVQSSNPIGKDNINGILESYLKFRSTDL
ncbi:MAG TPA: cyclic-phosphate processing receiver domain-containing protein [Candidatus Hodarchaeales archaeon]|nr:cyclic-phosphate processing receiver domain-containing protein [Candidatus Hodarchaeales archaeon]